MKNNDLSQIVLLDQLYNSLTELKNGDVKELAINEKEKANILLDLIIPIRNQLIDDFAVNRVCKILEEYKKPEGYITHLRDVCQEVCHPELSLKVKTPKKIDFKGEFFTDKNDFITFNNKFMTLIKENKNNQYQQSLIRAYNIIYAIVKAYKIIK